MKKINTLWLSAAMCAAAMLTGANALADEVPATKDNVYFENLSIAPGECALVELQLDNTEAGWNCLYTQFTLPEGLELEPLADEDLIPGAYTFETCETQDGKYFIALSTVFGDAELLLRGQAALDYAKSMGQTYPMYETTCSVDGSKVTLLFASLGNYLFGCTKPVLLFKMRANERLAEESAIEFNWCVFMGSGIGGALGETGQAKVNGTPTVARVRRVDAPAYNADVNGDGVVDIDDVNIVISTMLGK